MQRMSLSLLPYDLVLDPSMLHNDMLRAAASLQMAAGTTRTLGLRSYRVRSLRNALGSGSSNTPFQPIRSRVGVTSWQAARHVRAPLLEWVFAPTCRTRCLCQSPPA